jgi:hypothetical protein
MTKPQFDKPLGYPIGISTHTDGSGVFIELAPYGPNEPNQYHHSENPHPKVTLDFDERGNLLGVDVRPYGIEPSVRDGLEDLKNGNYQIVED